MSPQAVVLYRRWKRAARERSPRWRAAVFAFLVFLAVPLAVLGAFVGLRFSENVHVVAPGLVYRSAQLLPEELESVIAEYGIRSVISLAAPEPEQSWCEGEIFVTYAHQIARYGYRSIATRSLRITKSAEAGTAPFTIRG